VAVDRGGLQYTITLRDQFSKTTAKFRQELGATKAAFAEFQRGASVQKQSADGFKKTAAAIDEQQAALRRLQAESRRQQAVERTAFRTNQAAQKDVAKALAQEAALRKQAATDAARAQRDEQRAIKEKVDAQNRAAKQAQALNAARIKDEKTLQAQQEKEARAKQAADPGFLAQKRINDALKEEQVVRQQITQLRARAQQQFAAGDLLGGARSINQAKGLKESLDQIGSSASRTFFTFRRLVGILAVFTIARQAVQSFKDLVTTALAFNNTIESARIGIAGLIVTSAEVRDQFGQNLTGADAFNQALAVARVQVKALTQDAIKLGVPFQTLVETFQIAVAPGFGAGLNLDQIRQLTGSIAAAAKAIGLPQNQLAEEIRSLLAGTIQARTTRIATALGITNADVRRLKETGQLFDFLENKFKSFNVAAQRAARGTLSGVQEVVQGILQQVLGQAAGPLFQTLIDLGNELLDKVLTIQDATGEIKINPKVVQSFQVIFDALRDGVLAIRAAFADLGFNGLKDAFQAAGSALVASLRFAIGFAQTLFKVLTTVVELIRGIAGAFGLTEKGLGQIAGLFGGIIALTVVWDHTLGLTGLKIGTILTGLKDALGALLKIDGPALTGILTKMGIWAAILATVVAGADLFLSSVFDVNLNLLETIRLLKIGLLGGIKDAALALKTTAIQFKGAFTFQTQEAIDAEKMQAVTDSLREQKKLDEEIAAITTKAAERSNRGPGFDPAAQAKKSAQDFAGIISGVARQVRDLDALIKTIDDDLFKTGQEFRQAFNTQDIQGSAGKIQNIFSEQATTLAVNLKKIRSEQALVEKQIAEIIKGQNVTAERRVQLEDAASGNLDARQLAALKVTAAEGQLVSLFQDEAEINDAINGIQQKSVDLAIKKAAIVALESSRDLNREAVVLRAQAQAEQKISEVIVGRLGARRQATVEAENALLIAQTENHQQEESLQRQIQLTQEKITLANRTGPGGPTAAERAALAGLLTSLQDRLAIEQQIATAKEAQLEAARKEAALVESGTIGQGISRGFEDLAKDLPTAFEAGVAIVKQSTQQLADFISTSIVQAFDPTVDQSLQERFARFLQSIAQIILQQIVQLAIASALQQVLGQTSAGTVQVAAATTAAAITTTAATTAASIEIAAAQTAAAIRAASGGFGLHEGGLVPRGFAVGGLVGRSQRAAATAAHAGAQGLAIGGLPRPSNVHPADTIPAWLTPGEFVVRKSVVDNLGLGFFNRVNAGGFSAPSAPPSGAQAGEAAGMARGGLVSERVARAGVSSDGNGNGEMVVLPTLVAGEKELDRLHAGGKNAFIKTIRDNATTIRGILQGGK
jgi:hypothetical protein